MKVCERFDNLGFDGRSVRLGIMGGTFDPIHIGHLACAEQARETFGLDAVIFMVTGDPAFKSDRDVSPAADRLAMCRLATARNPYFDVSALEIERSGKTYTVDTMTELRAHYPDNVELYFITGADAIASIARWHRSEELARLTKFIAVTRPGYVVSDEMRSAIEASGFSVEYAEVTALALSSSYLRARVAEGKSIRYLTVANVNDYVMSHGLYSCASWTEGDAQVVGATFSSGASGSPRTSLVPCVPSECDDALSENFLALRRIELEQRVNARRFDHIEGVTQTAVELAAAYGVDARMARLAGMLHDWDKAYDDAAIRARACELGVQVDPWVFERMPHVLHAHTAAAALKRDFPCIPNEVLDAIDKHTVAALEMTPLDMVVYIADALEPGRELRDRPERLDRLRALVGKVPLDELFLRVYELWTQLLLERGGLLHPQTVEVWNHYACR